MSQPTFPPPHHSPTPYAGTFGQQGQVQQHPNQQHQPTFRPAQHHHHQPPQPPSGPQPKRPRTWLAVTTAALLAATLASGGTAVILDRTAATNAAADPGLTQVQGVPVVQSSGSAPDWEAVAAAVRPSVVAIEISTREGSGAGSGVIIDAEGHILTNNHVVGDAQEIVVTLWDGRMFAADVVGTDPATDLAVIKLVDPPEDLAAATLGTSADLVVGQDVMAVGNPLGLDSTVTTGIISALDRPVSASDGTSEAVVTNAIQSDAAVNPGNSGGPLFDAQGHVIGITSSIATLSGGQSGSIGLGFAIPVDLAANIAGQLTQNGTAEHAYLGVSLTDENATADGTTRAGAAVADVGEGTPADEAGLRAGDVITAINGSPVGSAASLTGFVRAYAGGTEVTLAVVRDGESIEVPVTLATKEDAAR